MSQHQENIEQSKIPITEQDIKKLHDMAKSLRYGSITLVFQDGNLIQLEKNEKVRVK